MRSFIAIVVLMLPLYLFSQISGDSNLDRYWFYRERLKYFVKVGVNEGESCISSFRNRSVGPNGDLNQELHFGDQTVFLGWYIGVLATEYKLLSDNNQDTKRTLYELYCAFKAFQRLDECEDKPPWNKPTPLLDGFFMKDDVANNFLNSIIDALTGQETNNNLIYLNENLNIGQTYLSGHPSYVNVISSGNSSNPKEIMSQDQAIHLLMGFALTKVCLPDHDLDFFDPNGVSISYNFDETARIFTQNIFDALYHNGDWRIHDPDGNELIDDDGGSTRMLGRGYIKAVEFITGNSLSSVDHPLCCWESIQHGVAYPIYIWNEWDAHLFCTIAAIGNSWRFLTANTTYYGIRNNSSLYNWDPFYITLWKFLHSDYDTDVYDQDISFELNKAKDQLDLAPCDGPYRYAYCINCGGENEEWIPYDYAPNGWASTCKYRMTKDEQNGLEGSHANFNGCDYMLMYNLYRLVKQPIGYNDFIDLKISNLYFPYLTDFGYPIEGNNFNTATIQAIETIEAGNMVVDNMLHADYNDPIGTTPENANVTMRAGKKIVLKSGFKVEHGAYFHAYIEPFSCSGGVITKAGSGLYSGSPMFTLTDSLYCAENYLKNRNESFEKSEDILPEESEAADNEIIAVGELQINIFPNPNDGRFSISAVNYKNQALAVEVYNLTGTMVYMEKANSALFDMDLSGQPAGIYYVVINADEKVFKKKLVMY